MDIGTLDTSLFYLINQRVANAMLDVLMPALSSKGYLLIFPYAIYLLWKAEKQKDSDDGAFLQDVMWAMGIALAAFLMADWIGQELKHLIARQRPCIALEGVRMLVGCSKSGSMPSNHAGNSFAYAVPFFVLMKRHLSLSLRCYPLILAGLVALSRPYVGVHYPSDIIAGALLGTMLALPLICLRTPIVASYKAKPYAILFFIGLAAISVFRIYYILHGPIDLSPDEAHYWEWSRRPDLSYYSKGPMIAYLIFIGTSLFGDTVLGIRIMAVLFSALSSICLFKLTKEMFQDESAACGAGLTIQIIPLFGAFGIIFSIDSPFIFFWVLSLYLFWKAIDINAVSKQSEGYGLWLLLGITMGLGLLTKYTMGFFHLCGLLFLLLSDKKGILKTAKPYLAVFVSIVVFSPVIIWNLQYDWVTFRHMTGHANIAAGMTVSAKDFFEFLGSQIGIVTPVFFIVMCIALFRKYPASLMTQYRFLFFFAVPVVGFFILKSVQGKVQANWAMTGYITGIIALAYYLADTNVEKISLKRYKLRQRVKWAGVVTALLITVVSLYPSIINLSPRLDPSARLRGWKQLGVELTKIYNGLWEKGGVLIFSDSYQISSEMAFYIKGNPITYCININRRMNQYDLWPGINAGAAQMRQQNKGSGPYSINGIYVSYDDTALPQTVADAFDNCEKKLIKAHDRKFFLRDYSVFICYNFKGLTTTKTDTY